MENSITWLLIADASKARLFAMHKARLMREQHPNNLEFIQDFTHHDSRKKISDLVSDKKGGYGKSGLGSGSYENPTQPKTHEADVFAHQLMHHLESERKNGTYRDLILVAPPAFMGLLHNNTPAGMTKLISQRIEKDYTQEEGHELINKLIKHF